MSEMNDLSWQIDLNNLTYYFKGKSISRINFIGFKAPLHLYRDISSCNIELAKAEEDQKQLKSDLSEITKGNLKPRLKDQIKTIKNVKNLYKSRKKIAKLFNDYAKIRSEPKHKSKYGKGLKILSPKQMLQRLTIALALVKAGNNSESLLNEIRQIVYSLYHLKETTKIVYSNIIKSINV